MFKNSLEFCLQGMFGNLIEKVSRCVQKKKMSFNLNSIQNEKDARVVIKDDMLKFHENDRRELFKKLWEDNFKKYKLSC
jgi:DNA polymerase III sliding clamp (beta) subunit (PCNA family)